MGFFSTILVRRASSSLKAAIAKSGGGFGVTQRSHLSAIAAIVNNNTRIQGAAFTSSSHYHFSTSSIATKKPTTDHTLVRVIESEIKCAQETDDLDRVEATPDAFPFEIQDNPGEQTILLKREYEGEVIKVEVHMPDLVTGEDDEDADEDNNGSQSSIPLVINITKGDGLELEFGVTAYPDEVAIESFSVKKSDTSEDQIPYEGPDFSSLDENLQKAFHKYLEIRGIKPSTTNFLHEYMINKDSREYLLWLKNLKKFVEK